jgi:Tfp pilus assembly protein PilN
MPTTLVRLFSLAVLVVGLLVVPARADDLSDARAFITKQIEQIKKGDVEGLKAGFTKRLQEKITEANVKKAQKEAASASIEDVVASVAPSKDSMKIKMKNGRTLTTLVKVDGKWLADTVWFK